MKMEATGSSEKFVN